MTALARDLGEPLESEVISPHETPVVFDKRRNLLMKADLDIVVQRANALQGCPDPQAFVDEVIKILEFEGVDMKSIPEFAWLKEAPDGSR